MGMHLCFSEFEKYIGILVKTHEAKNIANVVLSDDYQLPILSIVSGVLVRRACC